MELEELECIYSIMRTPTKQKSSFWTPFSDMRYILYIVAMIYYISAQHSIIDSAIYKGLIISINKGRFFIYIS